MKYLVFFFLASSIPAWASERDFAFEVSGGLGIAPHVFFDSLGTAGGLHLSGAFRWNFENFSILLDSRLEQRSQSERHSSVTVGSTAIGPGIAIPIVRWGTNPDRQKRLEFVGSALYGSYRYKIVTNSKTLRDGDKDFFEVVAGGRMYLPMGSRFEFFFGPELSYSSARWSYPDNYGDDEASPEHVFLGAKAGVSLKL